MIQNFHALNEIEQAVFLDQVDPQPEPEAPKQTRKKRGPNKPKPGSEPATGNSADPSLCVYQYPKTGDIKPGRICESPEDDAIHDHSMGYAGYHPFQHSAPVAAPRSSRKSRSAKDDKSPTPSTGTLTDSAGSAAQESLKSASAGD